MGVEERLPKPANRHSHLRRGVGNAGLHACLRSSWPFDSASTTTYPPSSFPSSPHLNLTDHITTPPQPHLPVFKMTEQYPQFCLSAQSYDQLYLGKPDVDTDVFDSLDKQSFDFAHYGAFSDVVAPHPEQFETDLDNSFASFDADVCSLPATFVDTPDIFSLRSDTPTRGAPSAFTVSSESASVYDSVYGENLSSYNYSTHSPSSQYSTSSYPLTSEEIDMDFKRLGLVNPVASDNSNPYVSISSPGSDNSSPSSVPLSSPPSAFLRGSFSDYEPSNQMRVTTSSMSDYYPSARYTTATAQATVSPANVSTQLPVTSQSANLPRPPKSDNGAPVDPKRKYPCPNCPRGTSRVSDEYDFIN